MAAIADHSLTLDGSTVSGNRARRNGGGIYVATAATSPDFASRVVDSTVSDNSAGGYGGGIYNGRDYEDLPSAIVLLDSTIRGNTAGIDGGGVFNDGEVFRKNTAFSDNSPNGCVGWSRSVY
jgi:predicted outer membrane repeat protein